MAESRKLPTIDETILKKRRQNETNQARHARSSLLNKKPQMPSQRIKFKRAEKFIKEFRLKQKDNVRLARQARYQRPADNIPAEPKLIIAIRTRRLVDSNIRMLKVLKMLRLDRVNKCTFLKQNTTTLNMLRIVEPYVTWGTPSLKTVRDLLYKRGYGSVDGKRTALTDNAYIEKMLGHYGIICIEDIIHELVTLGPRFKEVNAYLLHFKLNTPAGGWKQRAKKFVDGGECGERGDDINKLLLRMI